ncbi:MAG: Lipid export ATP-binding/permease protein msbA [Microbacteriaceae bacterium]|nr:Lipid export ATP-binding/permease protein msbA [Microbacteriaceae bacterium]
MTAAKPASPRGSIDPDTSKSWWRRVLPIARAHGVLFVTAIIISLLGLVLQVMIPAQLNSTINTIGAGGGAEAGTQVLVRSASIIAALAILAFASGLWSRYLQLKAAYEVEYDLRTLTFEHLARMS